MSFSRQKLKFQCRAVLPRHPLAIVVLLLPRCAKLDMGKSEKEAGSVWKASSSGFIAKYPELYRLDEFQDQPFDIYRVELTIDEYRHWLLEEFVFELGSQWLEWDVQHHRTTWCGCRVDNGIHRGEGTCHLPPREMEKHRRHHLRHPAPSETQEPNEIWWNHCKEKSSSI